VHLHHMQSQTLLSLRTFVHLHHRLRVIFRSSFQHLALSIRKGHRYVNYVIFMKVVAINIYTIHGINNRLHFKFPKTPHPVSLSFSIFCSTQILFFGRSFHFSRSLYISKHGTFYKASYWQASLSIFPC
ncbi:unnamed protein product, partial [Linum perenne]